MMNDGEFRGQGGMVSCRTLLPRTSKDDDSSQRLCMSLVEEYMIDSYPL